MIFSNETTAVSTLAENIDAIGKIAVPVLLAWIAWKTSANNKLATETHKAVNSTASLLAEKAVEKDKELRATLDKVAEMESTIARLRERAEGKQIAADLAVAVATMPPVVPPVSL